MKPIHITISPTNDKLECGASRFLGNPDLPRGHGYPMYTDDEGDDYPYFFVCQINMEDIARYDTEGLLPHKGLLSFFAKIDRYIGFPDVADTVGGYISDADAVRVIYFPSTADMVETVLVDDNDEQSSPEEMRMEFGSAAEPLGEEHAMLAPPDHRPWETWDPPYEGHIILLQIDSCEGDGFVLNFMDWGVMDFLIAPEDLAARRFGNVRAIVLST